jgi:glycosyltransferase involved in cell wall biosynthesis
LKPRVHFFGGQGIGWALDEDLNRARASVAGRIDEGSFACSPIILSAWWPPLLQVGNRALEGKSVICLADNPPAFYLTRPGFEAAASRVDLWVARSKEAVRQFKELGLPVTFAPYTVDPGIFRKLSSEERAGIRAALGFTDHDFVVGNFNRDSLERDLSLPKAQKGPDHFVELVDEARKAIPSLKVFLAGPRRHWLRSELARRGIPFVFAGKILPHDDFSVNVLPREELNRLYAALDCTLITSRWEGGPYSALESLQAGRPVISTRVGMAADLLDEWLYDSPKEGAELLARIARERPSFASRRQGVMKTHSSDELGTSLAGAFARFPNIPPSLPKAAGAFVARVLSRVHHRFRTPSGSHAGVAAVMENVRRGNDGGLQVASEAISIASAETTVQCR